MSYKSMAVPKTLDEAIDVIQRMQEYLQRDTTVQGGRDGDGVQVDTERRTSKVQKGGNASQQTSVRVPARGELLALINTTVRASEQYRMLTDFEPTSRDDTVVFVSDGRRLYEVSRSGLVGKTIGCPLIVVGTCNPAFAVQSTLVATPMLEVNHLSGVSNYNIILRGETLMTGNTHLHVQTLNTKPFRISELGTDDDMFRIDYFGQEVQISPPATFPIAAAVFEHGMVFPGRRLGVSPATATPYNIRVNDMVLFPNGVPFILNLPNPPAGFAQDGQIYMIRAPLSGVSAPTNVVTINAAGGHTVDGQASIDLASNGEVAWLMWVEDDLDWARL